MKTKIYNIAFFVIVGVIIGLAVLVSMNSKNQPAEPLIVGVHVKGAVNNPGYYELEYESRVKDALDIAGGATKDADLEKINLAQKLRDGEEVSVPYKETEVVSESEQEAVAVQSSDGKININTADTSELCMLDGIGEETAAKIIAYRDKNGKFNSVDELKNINGIGNAKFEKIEDCIIVK